MHSVFAKRNNSLFILLFIVLPFPLYAGKSKLYPLEVIEIASIIPIIWLQGKSSQGTVHNIVFHSKTKSPSSKTQKGQFRALLVAKDFPPHLIEISNDCSQPDSINVKTLSLQTPNLISSAENIRETFEQKPWVIIYQSPEKGLVVEQKTSKGACINRMQSKAEDYLRSKGVWEHCNQILEHNTVKTLELITSAANIDQAHTNAPSLRLKWKSDTCGHLQVKVIKSCKTFHNIATSSSYCDLYLYQNRHSLWLSCKYPELHVLLKELVEAQQLTVDQAFANAWFNEHFQEPVISEDSALALVDTWQALISSDNSEPSPLAKNHQEITALSESFHTDNNSSSAKDKRGLELFRKQLTEQLSKLLDTKNMAYSPEDRLLLASKIVDSLNNTEGKIGSSGITVGKNE